MGLTCIYLRISKDPLDLRQGVTRQREDCEKLCADRGLGVPVVFEQDNDVSAFSSRRRRFDYERLMAAVERGEVSIIVCWSTSRLWRNRIERAQAIEVLKQHRVRVIPVMGPEFDMTTAQGRMLAGVVGEFDTAESEEKAERVAREVLQRAEQGRSHSFVLYGWKREREIDARGRVVSWRDVENPAEAEVVREITDRLLAGETVKGIQADLNRRKVPSARGGPWTARAVRILPMRPANIALRVHHAGQPDEAFHPAAWPPILDTEKHRRVVALLTDANRQTNRDGARKHLLSFGYGVCGRCDGGLRVASKPYGGAYVCDRYEHLGRKQEPVDRLVDEVVSARLSMPDAASLFVRDDGPAREAAEKAAGLRARLDEAADAFANGEIDRNALSRITAKLRPQIEKSEKAAAIAMPGADPEALAGLPGVGAADRWAALSVSQKRAVLGILRWTVVLLPGATRVFRDELVCFRMNGKCVDGHH